MSDYRYLERRRRKNGIGYNLLKFLVILGVIAGGFLPGSAVEVSAATWNPALTRYPYLTDVVNSYATINFATDRSQATAVVRYGKVGAESCTARTVTATRRSFAVRNEANTADILEYQWKAVLRVEPASEYCYRVYLGTAPEVDLLGSDDAPSFRTQLPAGNNDAFSFIVFGDWGYVRTDGTNPIQAALMSIIAGSGARFAMTVGDNAYPTEGFTSIPGQTQYGDLNVVGPSRSAVFGSAFWKEPGKSIPLFPAIGNHGFSQANDPTNHPHVVNFPEENAAALSNGRYTVDTYCCANGSTSGNYPSVWYAIDAGIARIYVLEAAWADTNVGAADPYKMNYDYFFAPGTPHWEWLQADLASHPAAVKLAVMHYPMYSDSTNEPSDTYLHGADALEGLLNQYNVQMTFSGHGHFYERNTPPNANSVISYVVGGGGARLTPVGSQCSTWDAYAISWSYTSGGKVCNAPVPTDASQVHHIVKVTVDGGMVTVTPYNSLGQVFDEQTYNFTAGQENNAPSIPGGLIADVAGISQVQLSWGGSSDDTDVRGYTIYRNGILWDTVTGGATSYLDDRAPAGPAYTYQVDAFDIWGNHSSLSNAASPGGTPPAVTIYLPIIAR